MRERPLSSQQTMLMHADSMAVMRNTVALPPLFSIRSTLRCVLPNSCLVCATHTAALTLHYHKDPRFPSCTCPCPVYYPPAYLPALEESTLRPNLVHGVYCPSPGPSGHTTGTHGNWSNEWQRQKSTGKRKQNTGCVGQGRTRLRIPE